MIATGEIECVCDNKMGICKHISVLCSSLLTIVTVRLHEKCEFVVVKQSSGDGYLYF